MDNNRILSDYSPAVLSILHRSKGPRSDRSERTDATNSARIEIEDLRMSRASSHPATQRLLAIGASFKRDDKGRESEEEEDLSTLSKAGFIGETREFRTKMMENINIKMELERRIQKQAELLNKLEDERRELTDNYEHEKSVYEQEKEIMSKHVTSTAEELEALKTRNREMEGIREQYEETLKRLDDKCKEVKSLKMSLEKKLEKESLNLVVAEKQSEMVDENKRRCEDSLVVTQSLLLALKEDVKAFKEDTEQRLKETKRVKTQGKQELSVMSDNQLELAREFQSKILMCENDLKTLLSEKEGLENEAIRLEEKISSEEITQQQQEIKATSKEMNKRLERKSLINRNIELVNELNIVKSECESLENSLASLEALRSNAKRSEQINKKVNEESLNLKLKENDKRRKENDVLMANLTEKLKRLQMERQFIDRQQSDQRDIVGSDEGAKPMRDRAERTRGESSSLSSSSSEEEGGQTSNNSLSIPAADRLARQIEKETAQISDIRAKMAEDRATYEAAKEEQEKTLRRAQERQAELDEQQMANQQDGEEVARQQLEIKRLTDLNQDTREETAALEEEVRKAQRDHQTSRGVVGRNNEMILANEVRKVQTLREKTNNMKVVEAEEAQRQGLLKAQLEDLMHQLEVEVVEKGKSQQLRDEIEEIRRQMDVERETEISDRARELRANGRHLDELRGQKEQLKQRRREVEEQSAGQDKEIAFLKLSLDDLRLNKESWLKDVNTMRSHCESMKKLQELRTEQATKTLAQLKTQKQLEITILKNDATSLDNNLREIKAQNMNIQIETQAKEQQKEVLASKNETRGGKYQEMAEKIQANLERNRTKLHEMKQKFENVSLDQKAELERLKLNVEETEKMNNLEINRFSNEVIKGNDEERTEMRKKLLTITHNIDELNKQISANKDNFFSDITNLKIEISNSEQLVKKGESERRRLEEELSKASATSTELKRTNQTRLESIKKEAVEQEKTLEELKEIKEVLTREINSRTEQLESLRSVVGALEQKLNNIQEDLEMSKMDYIKATEENDNAVLGIKTKISRAKTRRGEIEREKDELMKEEAKIDSLIAQTKSAITGTSQRYQQQQQQHINTQYPLTISAITGVEEGGVDFASPTSVNGNNTRSTSAPTDIYDEELKVPDRTQIPALQNSIKETERLIEVARESFRANCIDLENKISEVEREIENALDEKEQKMEEKRTCEKESKLLDEKIGDEEDEVNDIQDETEQVKNETKTKETEIGKINGKITDFKKRSNKVERLNEIIEQLKGFISNVGEDVSRSLESEEQNVKELELVLDEAEASTESIVESDKTKGEAIKDEFSNVTEIVNDHIKTVLEKLEMIDKLQFESDSLLLKMESIISKTSVFGRDSSSTTTQEIMRTFSGNLISLFRSVSSQVDERKKLLNELAKCVAKCQYGMANIISFCAATRDDVIRLVSRRLNMLSSEREEAAECCDASGRSSGLLSTFIVMAKSQNECLCELLKQVEGFAAGCDEKREGGEGEHEHGQAVEEQQKELDKLQGDLERLSSIVPKRRAAPVLRVGAE